MTDPPDQTSETPEKRDPARHEGRLCPRCNTVNTKLELANSGYRCLKCGLELAHVDVAANGEMVKVFGYLHMAGDIVLNRYCIKSVLGKGGFAATYLAEDLRLRKRSRALKEIPEALFDQGEMELLSRLHHRAIPRIMDHGIENNMVYLALEFGGNRTLETERKRSGGRIKFANLIPWMQTLCEVLAYLHSHKPPIVHGDLKPANILLDEDGCPKLIDFGQAREFSVATETSTPARAASAGFSPPEQALGKRIDERSDIYALGATLYTLLTGKVPPAAHKRIAGAAFPVPSSLVKDIPAPLDNAVMHALELDINKRQQSIAEFVQVFDELPNTTSMPAGDDTKASMDDKETRKEEETISGPSLGSVLDSQIDTLGRKKRSVTDPWGSKAVAIGLAIAVAVGGYLYWRGRSPSQPDASPVKQTSIKPTDTEQGRSAELPPSGKNVRVFDKRDLI